MQRTKSQVLTNDGTGGLLTVCTVVARRRTGASVVCDDELHGERAGPVDVRGGGGARGLV